MRKVKRKLSKLRQMRLKRGMLIQELSARSGTSYGLVVTQERFGIKTMKPARRYAAILGCEPLELLD